MDNEAVVRLAFELSRSALDDQRAALDELRARTGTLLTAAALPARSWAPTHPVILSV